MNTDGSGAAAGWAPQECTLPTVERPVRAAEFNALFRAGLREISRMSATELRLTFDDSDDRAATIAELTARESECCSFFAFTVTPIGGDAVRLDVRVPATHVEVLDGLGAQAASAMSA